MKKGVLRIAAVALFAAVIFINISHGHVKASQGNKESAADVEVSVIEGDGVLEASPDEDDRTAPTIENIDRLAAGVGALSIASDESVEVADNSIQVKEEEAKPSKTEIIEEAAKAIAQAEAEIEATQPQNEVPTTDRPEESLKEENTEVLAGRSEPKTAGEDIPIVVLAVFALLADFFLVLIENAKGMTEDEKHLAIRRIKSGIRPGNKMSRMFAYVEIFTLLLYYHIIGKNIKHRNNYA